ncbi:MAG: IS66 family transposase zinc-finger binding domain-containing protein [Acidimicrobiales bacterium]
MVHPPSSCGRCGTDLSDAEVPATIVRQVFDLPPVALSCTEHQVGRRRRRCRTVTSAAMVQEGAAMLEEFPAQVQALDESGRRPCRQDRLQGRSAPVLGACGADHRSHLVAP